MDIDIDMTTIIQKIDETLAILKRIEQRKIDETLAILKRMEERQVKTTALVEEVKEHEGPVQGSFGATDHGDT
jgi:hypothetical protein